MEIRKALIEELNREQLSVAEVSRRYQVSRKTAYKWMERYQHQGEAGLADQSRAPHHQPQAIIQQVREQIVAVKRSHATWGPKKIKAYLSNNHSNYDWPATSTIGELLNREGLISVRRKRRRVPPHGSPLAHADDCNKVWTADFKGWFPTADGERCDPLTMQDAFSRFALRIVAVERTNTVHTSEVFYAAFRENGLPDAIRTDNGPPFASPAPGGLSRLSMRFIRLGIRHERIEPGCPQQNGRHERMHLTLLQDTASPPARDVHQQQKRFQDFLQIYNFERPHEALNNATPGSLYVPSTRLMPSRIPPIVYPDDWHTRRIQNKGDLRFGGQRTFLSEVLAGEDVGLMAVDEDLYEIYWCTVFLGWFDSRSCHFEPLRKPKPQHRRKVG
jgi:transposase InsO family protein